MANCHLLFARPLVLLLLLMSVGSTRLMVAQDSQDNQPQIQPRRDAPSSPPRRAPKPPAPAPEQPSQQVDQPAQPQTGGDSKGESSSSESQINLDAHPLTVEPALPGSEPKDDKTFQPWDPHRADKDIEVGNYYLRLKNYRAALDRFNDALLYKQGDAEATYGLAFTEEKLDLLAPAYRNYQEYLKILPSGAHAKDAEAAIKRLGPHLDARDDTKGKVDHDLEVGETYLSMNSFDAARERFEEVVRLEPDNARACFRLAQSLQGLRRLEPAKLYYQKYLALEPTGRYAADAKKAIAAIDDFLK